MPSGWSAPQPVKVHGQSTPTVCPQAREPGPWRQLCNFLLSSQFSAEQKQDRNLQRAGHRKRAAPPFLPPLQTPGSYPGETAAPPSPSYFIQQLWLELPQNV